LIAIHDVPTRGGQQQDQTNISKKRQTDDPFFIINGWVTFDTLWRRRCFAVIIFFGVVGF
jgi:hypothetical protein|tara:strand:- start:94 stop:273 length:180 start_codon:yes stop_codon:yes gene_type:complete